jgi:enoyl-CoA hydratase
MTEEHNPNSNDLIIRREGRAGRITLNRPKALNALTHDQALRIEQQLDQWVDDGEVQLVILDGSGDRALCAGGDVLGLYDQRNDGGEFASRFWRDEYRLNSQIGRYPKPYVALMDGIVMGGGIGLSAHASHRIVTERSMLAMPETTIGLVPDVGGMWLLANAPGRLGEYLGLLGERMAAADALYAGFADTFIESARLEDFVAALTDPKGDPVGVTVAAFAMAPPPPVHADRQSDIDEIFAAETVEDVRSRLAASDIEWASNAVGALDQRSPLSLKLTLAAVRAARRMASLEEVLNLEYRLTTRLFEHGEFIEGIRALLVDKDKAPKWNPARLEEITPDMIAEFMAPLTGRDELGLVAA